jgi:hypothetical protein
MDTAFIQARIDATKLAIVAYEDAIIALGTSNTQSYELDTGQDRQRVTRADLKDLNTTVDSLYNRCATLEARLNGGTVSVSPGW